MEAKLFPSSKLSANWKRCNGSIVQKLSIQCVHYATQYKQVKGKQSLKRSRQALRVTGGWESQISSKGDILAIFNPRKYSWYSFLLEVGDHSAAGKTTPSRIKPAASRLVA
jgi:hypothetical protein